MAEYHLLTIWRINAPLTKVYNAIHDSLHWPDWWPGSEKVEAIADGKSDGTNSIRRYAWRGKPPYPVVFDVRATCIRNHRDDCPARIKGSARLDRPLPCTST